MLDRAAMIGETKERKHAITDCILSGVLNNNRIR